MLLSFAVYGKMFPDKLHKIGDEDLWHDSDHIYSVQELTVMSGWSLLLTIENIIIIFIVSYWMFKIKQVVKMKSTANPMPIWKTVTNFKRKTLPIRRQKEFGVKRNLLRQKLESHRSHQSRLPTLEEDEAYDDEDELTKDYVEEYKAIMVNSSQSQTQSQEYELQSKEFNVNDEDETIDTASATVTADKGLVRKSTMKPRPRLKELFPEQF